MSAEDLTPMALQRIAVLRQEYEKAQQRLQILRSEQSSVQETLLRIEGAILVLQELLGENEAKAVHSVDETGSFEDSGAGARKL